MVHAQHFLQRALGDEPSAARTRAGADVEDVVGGADGVLVVLDDDDAIAQVAQLAHRGDEPVVVALVQADARLVEHVEHARQPGADLRGEPDALRFAAGERAAFAVEVEVAQAHFDEEPQPRGHFPDDLGGNLALGVRKFQLANERVRLADGQAAEITDVERAVGGGMRDAGCGMVIVRLGFQRNREDFRPQPRSPARRAGLGTHERLEPVFGQFALGGVEQVLHLGDQPIERLLQRGLLLLPSAFCLLPSTFSVAVPSRISTGSSPVPWKSACRNFSGNSANGRSIGASNPVASPRNTA